MTTQLDHYRLLGRSGLRVSPLSLGTMTFGVAGGGWGSTEEDAKAITDTYIGRGGNFIDTANFYSMGESERVLGRLIAGRREPLVISTKYSLTNRVGDPNASGNHRKSMVRSVEDSLQRLGTDYIDLLYLHMWESRTPVEEVLRAFDDLVRAGKVLYAGLSDTPAWQASRMQAIADLRGWTPFVALQIPYNLTERTVEREMIPMARAMGMGVCPWSPLAGGVLSGKYSNGDLGGEGSTTPGATSRKQINQATGRLTDHNLVIARLVGDIAGELGVTASQVALAWTMLDPAVTSPLIGARTPAQLEDNLGALDVTLSPEQIARLDDATRIERGFPHELLEGPAMNMMLGNVTVEQR